MKVTIESTEQIVTLHDSPGASAHLQGRVWTGHTARGIPVQLLIVRIAAPAGADQAEFQRELETRPAPAPSPAAFPLRMVL